MEYFTRFLSATRVLFASMLLLPLLAIASEHGGEPAVSKEHGGTPAAAKATGSDEHGGEPAATKEHGGKPAASKKSKTVPS